MVADLKLINMLRLPLSTPPPAFFLLQGLFLCAEETLNIRQTSLPSSSRRSWHPPGDAPGACGPLWNVPSVTWLSKQGHFQSLGLVSVVSSFTETSRLLFVFVFAFLAILLGSVFGSCSEVSKKEWGKLSYNEC